MADNEQPDTPADAEQPENPDTDHELAEAPEPEDVTVGEKAPSDVVIAL